MPIHACRAKPVHAGVTELHGGFRFHRIGKNDHSGG
jgi:hypothetical protein